MWGIAVAAAGMAAQLVAFGNSGDTAFIVGFGVALAGVALAFIGPWVYGSTSQGRRPVSRLLRIGEPFWLIGLLGLGSVAASASTIGNERIPVTLPGVTTHVHGAIGGGIESGNGSSPCEKSGPPVSDGQAAGGHGHRGPVAEVAITDAATRNLLAQQLDTARKAAMSFPTAADAVRGGYRMVTTYLPCIGAHYMNARYIYAFDPAHPAMLLYDGNGPDAKIVGLSYYVVTPGRNDPPEGFAGPNDHWHRHIGLCVKGGVVIGPEKWTKAQCDAAGGVKVDGSHAWMVHAWVVPGWESAWGVFSGEHPELGVSVPH
jgi:hypothetical protein